MNFTFGICTTYENIPQLREVVTSIQALNVPQAEILIVGSYSGFDSDKVHDLDCQHILVDGWLPKKKNMVAKFAYYENLVMLHDYYVFDPDWYRAYQKFEEEWDVCSNPQFLQNGNRHFTDWVVWDSPIHPRYHSLCHDDWTQTKYQYVSGGYFLVKRSFLRENPLNEELKPGSPEDVEWSLRIRDKAVIKCNPWAIVRHNKKHRDCK
jgi:hypothetical protein